MSGDTGSTIGDVTDVTPDEPRRFPRAWVTYAFVLTAIPVWALDGFWHEMMGWSLLLILTGFLLVVVEAIRLYFRIKGFGWRGALPFTLALLALPAGRELGSAPYCLRFELDFERYEQEANRVFAQPEPKKQPALAHDLGHWVRRHTAPNGDVVAVSFLVVSYGFAGHAGFLRAFDPETERRLLGGETPPGGWTWSRHIRDHWFYVAN